MAVTVPVCLLTVPQHIPYAERVYQQLKEPYPCEAYFENDKLDKKFDSAKQKFPMLVNATMKWRRARRARTRTVKIRSMPVDRSCFVEGFCKKKT
jgi:hypothetical protein